MSLACAAQAPLLNLVASYPDAVYGDLRRIGYSTVPGTTSLGVSHPGLHMVGLVMGLLTPGHQIGAAPGGYVDATNPSHDLVRISSIALATIAGVLVFLVKQNPVGTKPQFARKSV